MSPDSPGVPLIAISILNWNGWRDTLECLESVRRLDYPNYLAVVTDNASWDDSVERIRGWASEALRDGGAFVEYTREAAEGGGDPNCEAKLDSAESPFRLVLIRNPENLGFTGGNNVAMHYALHRRAPADYVFLLNNDTKIDPSCLSELVSVSHNSGAGIVGAVILAADTERIMFGGRASLLRQFFSPPLKWQLPAPSAHAGFWESFFVSGTAMLISSKVLRSISALSGEYFRTRLFMYGEELVLSYDAHRAGYRSVVAAKAYVRHKVAGSSGGRRNPLVYYYPTRNVIGTAKELLPFQWGLLFYLVNTPVCLARIARSLIKGRSHIGWVLLHSVIDGYRGVGGKWKHHDEEVRRHARR